MRDQLELGVEPITIDQANELLGSAVDIRCDLHQRREAGLISVEEYVLGLWWVRKQEDELEPIRAAAGFNFSRAWERCTVRTDYTGPSAMADEMWAAA